MLKMLLKTLLLSAVALSMSACSWVDTVEGSDSVALLQIEDVGHCEKLGSTTSSALDKVGVIKRSDKAVKEDLIKLAKNEAVRMHGDTIVVNSLLINGRMGFDVYRCAGASTY